MGQYGIGLIFFPFVHPCPDKFILLIIVIWRCVIDRIAPVSSFLSICRQIILGIFFSIQMHKIPENIYWNVTLAHDDGVCTSTGFGVKISCKTERKMFLVRRLGAEQSKLFCQFFNFCQCFLKQSSWYNPPGWLGVKNKQAEQSKLFCQFFSFSQCFLKQSWYNPPGWLGIKNKVTPKTDPLSWENIQEWFYGLCLDHCGLFLEVLCLAWILPFSGQQIGRHKHGWRFSTVETEL